MKGNKLKLAVAAGALALAGSLGVAGATFAQTGTQPIPAAPRAQNGMPDRGPGGPGGHGPVQGPREGGPQQDHATIAKALGIEATALTDALKAGKTVAELAKDKGVALDGVVQAVVDQHVVQLKKDLTQRFSNPAPQPPAGGPADGRGPRGGGPMGDMQAVLAKAFGMDDAALRSALQGGKSVADLAKDKGVALDTIVTALVNAHKTQLDAAVTAGRLTQAQADADLTRFKTDSAERLSQPMPQRPPGGRPGQPSNAPPPPRV